MERYKIDFSANTITVTAAFAKKLQQLDSEEFAFLAELRETIPSIRVVSKTHRTPSVYHNKDGSKSCCNQFKNLTYANMEQFISKLPNSEKYRAEYDFLKKNAGKVQRNGYTLVRKWFNAQFPDFRTKPILYLYNTPALVSASQIIQEAEQEASAEKKTA